MRICSVDGCNKKHSAHGYCEYHYNRTEQGRARSKKYYHSEHGKKINRLKAQRWRDKHKVVIEDRICKKDGCNKKFTPRYQHSFFCSRECRVAVYIASGKASEVNRKSRLKNLTPERREQERKSAEEYRKKYPEKVRESRMKTDNRKERKDYHKVITQTNKIYRKKKLSCTISGCTNTDIHKHHEDYNKPYEIIPLCRFHHLEYHGRRLVI